MASGGRQWPTAGAVPGGRQHQFGLPARCSRPSLVVPRGQGSVAWFSAAALLAIVLLANVSLWYSRHPSIRTPTRGGSARGATYAVLSRRKVMFAITILVALLFSKNVLRRAWVRTTRST